MFRPVGSLPPSVYWRRRFVLLGSLVALIVLLVVTLSVVLSGNSDPKQGAHGVSPGTDASSTHPKSHHRTSPASSIRSSESPKTTADESSAGTSADSSDTPDSSVASSAPPARCNVKRLGLTAESDKTRYTTDEQPQLSILVTNKGSQPCVQDLADPQIVLTVFNGEARVWGSHDCKIEPGTNDQTLMPGRSVRVSITWTGLSSKPHCAGTRQRVGAGSYTLYATLSGNEATSAQFTIG